MEPTVQAHPQNIGPAQPATTEKRLQATKSTRSRKKVTEGIWVEWLFMAMTVGAGIIVAVMALIAK